MIIQDDSVEQMSKQQPLLTGATVSSEGGIGESFNYKKESFHHQSIVVSMNSQNAQNSNFRGSATRSPPQSSNQQHKNNSFIANPNMMHLNSVFSNSQQHTNNIFSQNSNKLQQPIPSPMIISHLGESYEEGGGNFSNATQTMIGQNTTTPSIMLLQQQQQQESSSSNNNNVSQNNTQQVTFNLPQDGSQQQQSIQTGTGQPPKKLPSTQTMINLAGSNQKAAWGQNQLTAQQLVQNNIRKSFKKPKNPLPQAQSSNIQALADPIPAPIVNQSKIIINISKCTYDIVKEVAKQDLGWRITRNENFNSEWDVYFADLGIDSEHLAQMKPYQKINHFPAMYLIARKTFLGKNLKKLSKLCPEDYQFFPRTWILPQEINDLRYYSQNYYKKQAALSQPETGHSKGGTNANHAKVISVKKTSIPTNKDFPQSPQQTQNNVQRANSQQQTNNFNTGAREAVAFLDLDGVNDELTESQLVSPKKDEEEEEPIIADTLKKNPVVLINGAQVTSAMDLYESQSPQKSPSKLKKQPHQQAQPGKKPGGYLTFIVKPDCQSQGKGIFLTNNVDEIASQVNNNPTNERIVVQEYLKDPYLIDNLKFDIRLYVLITSCDPLKIFLYHDGIVRFATEEFKAGCLNQANIDNMFIHLTNYAINKDNGKFKHSKNALDDEGHKRSFQTVMNRLRLAGHDVDQLLLQIKDIIVKTMLCIQPDLLHNYRTCQPADRECSMCFELLGFDIIIDKTLKPYLLEVNHAPSFNTDTPLDFLLKKHLLYDTLKLLGMSVEEKKRIIQNLHDMKHQRLLQKQTLKEKIDMLTRQLREKQRAREEYEMENLGGYDRIYPLPADDPRQQRYNEIVKAVYNNEAEVQIRKVTKTTEDAQKKQNLINKMAREKVLQQIQNAKPTQYQPPQHALVNSTGEAGSQERPPQHLVPRHLSQRLQQLHHQPHQIVFKRDPNYIPPELLSIPFTGTLSTSEISPYASIPHNNQNIIHLIDHQARNMPTISTYDGSGAAYPNPDPFQLAKELIQSESTTKLPIEPPSTGGSTQPKKQTLKIKQQTSNLQQAQIAKWIYTWDHGGTQLINGINLQSASNPLPQPPSLKLDHPIQHHHHSVPISNQVPQGLIHGRPMLGRVPLVDNLPLSTVTHHHQSTLYQPLTTNHHYLLPSPQLILQAQNIAFQQSPQNNNSIGSQKQQSVNGPQSQNNQGVKSQHGSRMSNYKNSSNQGNPIVASIVQLTPQPMKGSSQSAPNNNNHQGSVKKLPFQQPPQTTAGHHNHLHQPALITIPAPLGGIQNTLPQLSIQHRSLQLPPTSTNNQTTKQSQQQQYKTQDLTNKGNLQQMISKDGNPHSQFTISVTGINGQSSYNSGIDNKMNGSQSQFEAEKQLNKDLPQDLTVKNGGVTPAHRTVNGQFFHHLQSSPMQQSQQITYPVSHNQQSISPSTQNPQLETLKPQKQNSQQQNSGTVPQLTRVEIGRKKEAQGTNSIENPTSSTIQQQSAGLIIKQQSMLPKKAPQLTMPHAHLSIVSPQFNPQAHSQSPPPIISHQFGTKSQSTKNQQLEGITQGLSQSIAYEDMPSRALLNPITQHFTHHSGGQHPKNHHQNPSPFSKTQKQSTNSPALLNQVFHSGSGMKGSHNEAQHQNNHQVSQQSFTNLQSALNQPTPPQLRMQQYNSNAGQAGKPPAAAFQVSNSLMSQQQSQQQILNTQSLVNSKQQQQNLLQSQIQSPQNNNNITNTTNTNATTLTTRPEIKGSAAFKEHMNALQHFGTSSGNQSGHTPNHKNSLGMMMHGFSGGSSPISQHHNATPLMSSIFIQQPSLNTAAVAVAAAASSNQQQSSGNAFQKHHQLQHLQSNPASFNFMQQNKL